MFPSLSVEENLLIGGQVRRGERGSQVVYMGETTKRRQDESTGEEREEGVRFLKTYTVFNVGQIDGLPEAFAIPPAVDRKSVV